MEILEDNKLFRRLGLTKDCSLILNIDPETFRECFNDNVSDNVNFFGVSGHNKNFHGRIRIRSFDIYRPTSMTNNTSHAITKGTFENHDSKTKVFFLTYISINMILIFGSVLLVIAGLANYTFITSDNVPMAIFFGFNGFFIFLGLLAYWSIRKSVTTLVSDVEREFGFWVAKVNALQQRI